MKRYIIIWCSMIIMPSSAQKKPWTWQYRHVFTAQQKSECADKSELIFTKTDVPLFTQLLFSWNALRPKQGYYSFHVQVHSQKKNTWGSWHKIADWGKGVQRSYETVSDGICRNVYVRLEIEPDDKADGFRIKTVAHNTGISGLQSFMVNTSDFTKFVDERVKKGSYGSIITTGVPQKSQLMLAHEKKRMLCSPTSCSMLCDYITREITDPIGFADHVYDNGLRVYGSWPFNMAHAFELAGDTHNFYTTRLSSFKALHEKLKQSVPVVVSVRGVISGAPKEYENGHLMLVIGYDAQKHVVICHDPAASTDAETLKEYPIDSFIKAWDRSRRLSYIAMPNRDLSIRVS